MKIIYIIGSGHCGSTLLDMILGSHSDVFGLGEIHNIRLDNECACGEIIENCKYWRNLKNKIDTKKLAVFRTKKDFLLNLDKYKEFINPNAVNIKEYLNINKIIFDNISEKSGKQVIVDSSKDANRLELLLKDTDLNIVVVHIVRDGRAVFWSYFKKYQKILPYMFKWFLVNLKIEIIKRRNNVKSVLVRYEDLTVNPKKEISKILNMAGLNYEESMLDFRKFEHHQVEGNRMRKSGGGEIKVDMEWKEKMPLKYKILFNTLFGWMNWLYKIK